MSRLFCCFRGGEVKDPVLVDVVAEKAPPKAEGDGTQPADSGRRQTIKRRRRVAVAAESTEQLANARWKSAFDAMRSAEVKSPEMTAKIVSTLKEHSIFGQMESALLDEIVVAMRTTTLKADEVVITQGDAGDAFYVVGEGTLAAFIESEGDTSVAEYGAGDSFGELALLYDSPRAASVRCTSAAGATLYKLGRIPFRNLVSTAIIKAKDGLETRLAKVPVLSGLSKVQLKQLAEAMEPVDFEDGQYIEEMGAKADSLYVVLAGEVACHKAGEGELRLTEGSVFGESSLLSKEADPRRQANVVAVGRVRTARLMASDLSDILGPLQKALDHAFIRKVIGSVELFSHLAPEQLATMLRQMQPRTVASGETIISHGTPGTTFYLIKLGGVDVISPTGTKIASLVGGDYFGERSLLKEEPTVASVVATEATELLGLAKADFERLLGTTLDKIIAHEVAKRDKQRIETAAPTIAWSELDVRQVLGEGSFGSVRLTVHTPSKTPYALKAMHKGHLIATNQVNNTINEKRIMQECEHPFILTCAAAFHDRTHVKLLLGLALGGELFTRMSKVGTLRTKDTALYVAMVASALGFLTSRMIAHRDLKLENLMFDEKGYLKLVDFGFAKVVDGRTFTFCGTPDYLAPEILAHKGHTFAVDWWTLGILTYEMLHGEPPFCEDDQMATFKRISVMDYRISSQINPDAADLIRRFLQHNPAKRYGMLAGGASDVFNHNLCKHIDVDRLLKKELPTPWAPKIKDPLDTSNFDSYPAPSGGKKYDKHLDSKYDETWTNEFGKMH